MAESETQEQGAMGEKARSASAARQRNGRRADGLDGDLQARARATTGAAKLGKGKERWKLYPVKGWPGIYRRGEPDSGPYVVVVRVGKRGQVKRTCRTLAEARVVQAELRRSAPGANSFRRGATPFTTYALSWVADYSGAKRGRKIKEHTRAEWERMLVSKEIREAFAGVRLADVTVDHLEDYAHLLAKEDLKPQTVRNRFAPVKRCLADAQCKGHITANPALGYVAGAAKDVDDYEVRALDEIELAALRAAVERRRDRNLTLLVDFLWQTGLRIGEALALDRVHLDLGSREVGQGGFASIERRIYKDGFAQPKSRYGKRTVPLSPEMCGRLRRHLLGAPPDRPVFLNFKDARLTYNGARGRFVAALKKQTVTRTDEHGNTRVEPLEWVTLHMLRHTCASLLLRRKDKGGLGLNAREAQHWLGHHSAAFTMDVYATFFEDELPSAGGFDAVAARLKETAAEKSEPHLRAVEMG